jgi:transposase
MIGDPTGRSPMPSRKRERQLFEAMWSRVSQLLPPHPAHPKGGRPFADDKACFAGIVYQLRNAIRWLDMPEPFPSGVTCWRRFDLWTKLGLWPQVWAIILEELQAAGKLDLSELAIDATFAEARKGGTALEPQNAA